ncbi:MAG: hypothetical protein WCR29_02105 [Bacteroidales bacterium]|nr:hypothetical protein [Bacteroidales bacterium]
MKQLIIIAIFLGSIGSVFAQEIGEEIVGQDKPISTPFCTAVGGWTFPDADMADKYQSFMNLNANLGWKTKENFLWMVEFGFGFGSDNAKGKNQILSGIMTNEGDPFVISREGSDAGVVAYNRNLSLVGKVGKVFPLSRKRPNSGIMLTLGLGAIQHQIIYQSTLEVAEQLEGDYAYLYDRQMKGIMVSGFIGYFHMSKKSYTNFYVGLELDQAWTKLTRDYQINYTYSPNKIFQDRMWTLKIGWMFPFFGRDADKIYYF